MELTSDGALWAVENVFAPTGGFLQKNVFTPTRDFSVGLVGDGATTILGGTIQAGIEIGGLLLGYKSIQSSLSGALIRGNKSDLFDVQNSRIGGAAFLDGLYVHGIKPRTNLELYGKAATRTPEQAKGILQRLGFDKNQLDEYHFISLDDVAYQRRVELLGGHFDATYGNVSSGVRSVSFKNNIQSTLANGELKIPVYVKKDVFDSDESIAQVLSHEIFEIEELRYLAHNPISSNNYFDLVRPNKLNNLHYDAVFEGDAMLKAFRALQKGGG